MAKMTTAQAIDLAVPILSASRKVRDLIEGKLKAKREAEDATAQEGVSHE